MKIYNNRATVIDVTPEDNSYYYSELRGEEYYLVGFTLTEYIDIPLSSYIDIGEKTPMKYFLCESPTIVQINSSAYHYKARFEGCWCMLKKRILRNNVDGRTSFVLTATPREHLQMILEPLQLRKDTLPTYKNSWVIDDNSIDSQDAITISYDGLNCWEGLQLLASELNVDFEIKYNGTVKDNNVEEGYVYRYSVLLKKIEHNYDKPLELEYGNGKGFKGNVERIADESSVPTGVAIVKTSNKNIHSTTGEVLMLPDPENLSQDVSLYRPTAFDGERFNTEALYDEDKGRAFTISKDRLSVNFNDNTTNTNEKLIDCTDIFPSTVLEVTGVVDEDNYVKVQSSGGILNKIPGKQLTIIFQSGMLAGKEFACEYTVNGYTFQINKVYVDDVLMPDGNFLPKIGDKFIVLNATFSFATSGNKNYYTTTSEGRAQIELLRKALKELIKHEKPQFSYRGEIDDLWLKKQSEANQKMIMCGGCVKYKAFGEESLLRIEVIKRDVNNPYKVELTFGNKVDIKPRYSVKLLKYMSLTRITENRTQNFRTQTINSIKNLQ